MAKCAEPGARRNMDSKRRADLATTLEDLRSVVVFWACAAMWIVGALVAWQLASEFFAERKAATYQSCVARGGKITEGPWGVSCVGVSARVGALMSDQEADACTCEQCTVAESRRAAWCRGHNRAAMCTSGKT